MKWIFLCVVLVLSACADDQPVDSGPGEDVGGFDTNGDEDADAGADADSGEDADATEDEPDVPAPLCEQDQARCADTATRELCVDPLIGFTATPCEQGRYCLDGACVEPDCAPGEDRCADASTREICGEVEGGLPAWSAEACADGTACAGGTCQDVICDPQAPARCDGPEFRILCPEPGVAETNEPCLRSTVCADGECVARICTPGTRACTDQQVIVCNDTGTGFDDAELCQGDDVGTTCFEGNCIDACELARRERSYIGCDYHPTDLPNSSTNLQNGFGIAVANTDPALTATVIIETRGQMHATLTIPPNSVRPWVDTVRNFNVQDTGVFPVGFKLTATIPVVAYQFNMYETIGSASTDGSLLLPDHALFNQYYAMTYSGDGGGGSEPYLGIYAVNADTEVTVTPSADTSGSANGSTVVLPRGAAGVPFTVTLQPLDVLVVRGRSGSTDLTGSLIEATGPIGVFGGNRAAQVPVGRTYRDHLEQQTFPRQALGTRYIVAKSRDRGQPAIADQVRVLADVDSTTIRFDPALNGVTEVTLDAGEWREYPLTAHTEITSDGPVMVGQFFAGSGGRVSNQEGDPTFIIQVPIEQYRADYAFLAPPTYTSDYVAITAPPSAAIEIDGTSVDLSETTIGATGLSVTVVQIPDGEHRLVGDQQFGVVVYGFGGPPEDDPNRVQNVSYGYPAGLNLAEINPKE
jgi:hypothetical protein